jgi:hypothetical protein
MTRLPRNVVLALLAACAATYACDGFVGEWTILDGFGARFKGIGPGQTEQQVLAALGAPARESKSLTLPQLEGYEAYVKEAEASRASRFLYWGTGVDEVAVVGLTGDGRVVFKCRAGT